MGITDSMKKWIGLEEIEEDEDDAITEEEIAAAKEQMAKEKNVKDQALPFEPISTPAKKKLSASRSAKAFGSVNTGEFRMVLIEPKNFEECPKLVDSLKARKPIIINLEKIETDEAKKIFDFMSGATYALNGNVQKVANNIFIFAPENVDISADAGERSSFSSESSDGLSWR